MKCTWKDCKETAIHTQLDNYGNQWVNLCHGHHMELEQSLEKLDVKTLLRNWVLANGGAKEMARKM